MPAMISRIAIRVCRLFVVLALAGQGFGQITFTRIVDTSTPIPGGTGTFTSLGAPSLRNGNLAFGASGPSSQSGIYTVINGSLGVVADRTTPVPSGTGAFDEFGWLSFDGASVVFAADGSGPQRGYYTNAGGPMRVSADRNTPMPDASGNFEWGYSTGTVPFPPSIDHGKPVFYGERFNQEQGSYEGGFYRDDGGALSVVVDHNTPAPDGLGILGISPSYLSADAGNVGFRAYDSSGGGAFYLKTSDSLRVVVDSNTPIPGGTGTFSMSSDVPFSISGGAMAFKEYGSFGQQGIYLHDGNTLRLIADKSTLVPGGIAKFTDFFALSLDGDNVAFWARDSLGHTGVYAHFGGTLIKLVGFGEVLDGKVVMGAGADFEGLSDGNVAFIAGFSDRSIGIYVATIPEPTTLILLFVGMLVTLCHRWR